MNLMDEHIVVKFKAFETLHPYDAVYLHYGKVKKASVKDEKRIVGIVVPMLNPSEIKRNQNVVVLVLGVFYTKSDEIKELIQARAKRELKEAKT